MKTATGKFGALVASGVVAASLWAGLGGSMNAAAPPPDPETCLPSCVVNDGRFLVVAGADPTTLSSQNIVVGLRFSEFSGDGNFGLFDADRNAANWDVPFEDGIPGPNPDAPKITIQVFVDPNGTGGEGAPVASFTPGAPTGGVELGAWEDLPFGGPVNNAWTDLQFTQHPDAFNPTGHFYQYAFHFSASNAATDKGWNAFKFRANGTTLILGKQVVGFLGGMTVPNDVSTIYPDFPNSLNGTTYNGEWTFQANLPSFLTQVTMFDGDMDFGAENCQVYNDTDDPDSSGIPIFATGAAVAEGVAQATGNAAAAACDGVNFANGTRTGLPSDDNSSPAFQRSPGIVPAGVAYQLVAPGGPKYPGGQIFLNENVSGNREWEQFRIQKVAPADFNGIRCPAGGYAADATYPASDCRTDELPGGGWQVQLRGMDLANLNFFYFDFEFQPPDPNVYSIGRLVWFDADKDGVQDLCAGIPCAPELGIAGVAYSVFDPASVTPLVPVRTGVTNATGEFLEINLPAANYTVVVDASNFGAGQPLEGLESTTGGETETGVEVGLPICTDPGVPANCGDPLYDEAIFGYAPPVVAAAVLIIDEDTIDEDKPSIKAISLNAPHCGGRLGGPGNAKVCINEDIPAVGQRTPLFTRPRDVTPISNMVLPTGRVNDEGLFMFTLPDLQQSAQNGATFTRSEFFFGTGAVANENNLDKIKGVRPLGSADIYALEGKAVCAVVYDSDISWDKQKVWASLKGATVGVTAFTVTDVTPNPAGGSYLPLITFDLLPIAAHATVCNVSGG